VILFQPVQFREGGADFRIIDPTQSRKQRLLLVSRVLGCRLREVAQGGLERPAGFIRRGLVYDLGDANQHPEEHLYAPVAVRQSCGIVKLCALVPI